MRESVRFCLSESRPPWGSIPFSANFIFLYCRIKFHYVHTPCFHYLVLVDGHLGGFLSYCKWRTDKHGCVGISLVVYRGDFCGIVFSSRVVFWCVVGNGPSYSGSWAFLLQLNSTWNILHWGCRDSWLLINGWSLLGEKCLGIQKVSVILRGTTQKI